MPQGRNETKNRWRVALDAVVRETGVAWNDWPKDKIGRQRFERLWTARMYEAAAEAGCNPLPPLGTGDRLTRRVEPGAVSPLVWRKNRLPHSRPALSWSEPSDPNRAGRKKRARLALPVGDDLG